MRSILLVVKHEIRTTLSKPSFWIMAFLFPVFIVLINVGTQVITARSLEGSDVGITSAGEMTPEHEGLSVGYVDLAGLIQQVPDSVPAGALVPYPDEASAHAALQAGAIDRYAIISADYVQSGRLTIVERDFRPLAMVGEELLEYVIDFNLTGSQAMTAALIEPFNEVRGQALGPQSAAREGTALAAYVPMATLFIFFLLLTMSSGLMLQSVSREKENRTAEVLLLSLRPRELMLGKIVGLSAVALLQMAIWVGGATLFLSRGQALLDLATGIQLPPGFFWWAVLYFLLGYLMYASLMGAVGALAPDARSGGQFTMVVLLPLMVPVLVNTAFIGAPHGGLATALSLIPLTAPTAMMTRLAVGSVPGWQVAVSLVGLAVTTYLLVLLSARFFRADMLLSQSAINWERIVRELRSSGASG